jgi:hypothetical protein
MWLHLNIAGHTLVFFGNYWLILALMLGGDFLRARSFLPPDPQTLFPRSPYTNMLWFGALFIKTGEADTATAFLNRALSLGTDTSVHSTGSNHSVLLPLRALAYAGLALLNSDPEMAATAANLTRQALSVKSWQIDLYCALIKMLSQEPGGAILTPVSNILFSIPRRRESDQLR